MLDLPVVSIIPLISMKQTVPFVFKYPTWIAFVKIQIWDRKVSYFNDWLFAETLCHISSDLITQRSHPVFSALLSPGYKALLLFSECFNYASKVNGKSLSMNCALFCFL